MVAIVGGGISGLSAAWFLHQAKVSYRLFETSNRVGGNIHTKKIGDYLLEFGPNSILCDQNLLSFFKKLSLADELMLNNSISKNRYIFKDNRYQKLPVTPLSFLSTQLLSSSAKLSIFKELFNQTKSPDNETVGSFFERRFSKEIVDVVLSPFVSGIYAGDPYQLLVKETFPMLLKHEAKYGSTVRGLIKNAKMTQRKQTYGFKSGMHALPRVMSEGLHISYNMRVEKIEKRNSSYYIHTCKNAFAADSLILAVPANIAADLLRNIFPTFAQTLDLVHYPPMAVVHSVFKKAAIGKPLNGFGGLNPLTSGLFSAGTIWNSNVFNNKCPQDKVLLTTFVGGVAAAPHALKKEKEICDNVTKELKQLYQISCDVTFQHFFFWQKSIPQYDKNILAVLAQVPLLERENVYICANWLGGVSLPSAITKGEELASRLTKLYI